MARMREKLRAIGDDYNRLKGQRDHLAERVAKSEAKAAELIAENTRLSEASEFPVDVARADVAMWLRQHGETDETVARNRDAVRTLSQAIEVHQRELMRLTGRRA